MWGCIITKDSDSYQSMLDILSKVWNLVYSEASDYEIKVRNDLSTLFCILNRFQKNIKETIPFKMPNYLPEKRVQVLLDYIHTHHHFPTFKQNTVTLESNLRDSLRGQGIF